MTLSYVLEKVWNCSLLFYEGTSYWRFQIRERVLEKVWNCSLQFYEGIEHCIGEHISSQAPSSVVGTNRQWGVSRLHGFAAAKSGILPSHARANTDTYTADIEYFLIQPYYLGTCAFKRNFRSVTVGSVFFKVRASSWFPRSSFRYFLSEHQLLFRISI